jgi:hypothetical protein
MARETWLDGAITRLPRASEPRNSELPGQALDATRSGKDVTRNTGCLLVAASALQALPALCACTMSMRSPAISLASWRTLRSMRSGLKVSFGIGSHSPPKVRNAPTSGPPLPATMARAPDCNNVSAISTAACPAGSSHSAGTSCRTVAPASAAFRGRPH